MYFGVQSFNFGYPAKAKAFDSTHAKAKALDSTHAKAKALDSILPFKKIQTR
jgi:hypothetical protein